VPVLLAPQVSDPTAEAAVLVDQAPTVLAHFVNQRIWERFLAVFHGQPSAQRVSGLRIVGVMSPRRRLITVMCSTLFGFAR